MVQAMYVDGRISGWRWLESPPINSDDKKLGEMDFNFLSIVFYESDEPFMYGHPLVCNNTCILYLRTTDASNIVKYSKGFTFASNVSLSVNEANAALRNALPKVESIQFKRSERSQHCLVLEMMGNGRVSYNLGSSCTGLLPPLPPITPRPPEPLSCAVTWQNSGEIDFGVMTPGENKVKGIAAKLACQGGTSGKARLRFTDVNQVGANTVTLRKSGTSDEIKAKLSIGDPNSSNEQVIDVSPGFNATYAFVAKLDGAQLSGIDGGTFSGNALIVFEVI